MKKPARSETLTIRLDPKTRFMLEFMARLRGQTITTVVERAITEAAGRAEIVDEFDPNRTWKDYWSIIEGARALNIAAEPELFPTYEEDKRLAFAREHWPFFYTAVDKKTYVGHFIEVLWPRIDEFISMHERERANDYFAAAKAMSEALSRAKLKAPIWPPPPAATSRFASTDDKDDEIPF